MWNCQPAEDSSVHVLPVSDVKSHVEAGEWCHCKPRIEHETGGAVVIHNAYDGREFYETEALDADAR